MIESPERELWQAVLFQALLDATNISEFGNSADRLARRKAKAWMDRGDKDFRMVCNLAGMDPDFVRDCYITGRISHAALKSREVAA